MQLLDFSGIAFGAVHTDLKNNADVNINFIRHLILNRIRMYNKKYRDEYGEMCIVLDCTHGKGNSNWRYDYFRYYKASRAAGRKKSTIDWDAIFKCIHAVVAELKEHFPYKVLEVPKCEADDIIGYLCERKAPNEKVMIISADKDFRQLQRYPNVKQYSPIVKKQLVEKEPLLYIKEHTIRGDSSDGVPNVLSPEDIFIHAGRKQKSITKKILAEWLYKPVAEIVEGNERLANRFKINRIMIDLSCTPQVYKDLMEVEIAKPIKGKVNRLYKFFIKNQMQVMLSNINDFLPAV